MFAFRRLLHGASEEEDAMPGVSEGGAVCVRADGLPASVLPLGLVASLRWRSGRFDEVNGMGFRAGRKPAGGLAGSLCTSVELYQAFGDSSYHRPPNKLCRVLHRPGPDCPCIR